MSVDIVVATDNQSKPKEDNPYADYMWMGEEEREFEEDVLAQLEEEEYLEYCFQDMMEEEALGLFKPPSVYPLSSSSTTGSSTTLPPLQNLSISNANGSENGHHDNGDVVLVPTNSVGAGGDAGYETWQNSESDYSGDKNDNQTDSDSSEGCPQR